MDAELDRRLSLLEEEIKFNGSVISDLHTVLMGPAPGRNNGVRGDLKNLSEEFNKAMIWANDVWSNKRREECIGIEETKKIWIEIEKIKKEAAEMAIAKVNLKGVYLLGILQFIGTIIVAIIAASGT